MTAVPAIARDAFLQRLDQLAACGGAADLGLLLVDITNLREINHRHAYDIGDAVLAETARELEDHARAEDTVFRIASHTFAVILPTVTEPALLPVVIGRLRGALEEALQVDGYLTAAECLIAVALNRAGRLSALLTLARAEEHLAALRRGDGRELSEVLEESQARPDDLIRPFTEALHDNDFLLYYQPKVAIGSGQLAGAEALLRWHDPERGWISPEVAVQIAEDIQRSFELTKWVVHAAARQYREWAREGRDVPLSVNIPASLIDRADLPAMINAALKIWDMPPAHMTLEITEQAFMRDAKAGLAIMTQLRQLGCRISIDDFGTGYSSLAYFRDIPACELKVDRSFVSRLLHSPQDEGLVGTIVALAKIFGMRVVAEGLEDADTLDRLSALGCEVAQGFGIARPLAAADFTAWADRWEGSAALRRLPATALHD
ncbi:MAG: putative bifunctional diguanylate cyclase/phosphodiesterase [Pseudohaliea sp.]